jgi:hypothetical protein
LLTLDQKSFQWCTIEPTHWTGERAITSPHRYKPRVDSKGRFYGYRASPNHMQMSDRMSDGRLGRDQYDHPYDQHNRVRRERILDGSDVRTTVMLRNIPGKLDRVCICFHSRHEPSLTALTDGAQDYPRRRVLRHV